MVIVERHKNKNEKKDNIESWWFTPKILQRFVGRLWGTRYIFTGWAVSWIQE